MMVERGTICLLIIQEAILLDLTVEFDLLLKIVVFFRNLTNLLVKRLQISQNRIKILFELKCGVQGEEGVETLINKQVLNNWSNLSIAKGISSENILYELKEVGDSHYCQAMIEDACGIQMIWWNLPIILAHFWIVIV